MVRNLPVHFGGRFPRLEKIYFQPLASSRDQPKTKNELISMTTTTHNFTTMLLLLLLSLLYFSFAIPRKEDILRKASLAEGKTYLRQQAVASLIGPLPTLSEFVTFRTVGKLPILPIDGTYTAAEAMFKKILQVKEKNLGPDDLDTLDTVNDLALVSMHQGKFEEAYLLYQRVAVGMLVKLGTLDPRSIDANSNHALLISLAHKLSNFNYLDNLQEWFSTLYTHRKINFGDYHPETLKIAMSYADLLHENQSSLEHAQQLYQTVLSALPKVNETSSPEECHTFFKLSEKYANLLYDLKEYGEAKEIYEWVLQGREKVFGKFDVDTFSTTNNFANLLLQQGNFSHARSMYESALKGYESQYGTKHPETLKVVNNLAAFYSRNEGDCQYKQLSIPEARKGYSRAVEGFERALGSEHKYHLTVLSNQANLLFLEEKMMIVDAMHKGPTTANQSHEGGKPTCNEIAINL